MYRILIHIAINLPDDMTEEERSSLLTEFRQEYEEMVEDFGFTHEEFHGIVTMESK